MLVLLHMLQLWMAPSTSVLQLWMAPSTSVLQLWMAPSTSVLQLWMVPSTSVLQLWIVPSTSVLQLWMAPSMSVLQLWMAPSTSVLQLWMVPSTSVLQLWMVLSRVCCSIASCSLAFHQPAAPFSSRVWRPACSHHLWQVWRCPASPSQSARRLSGDVCPAPVCRQIPLYLCTLRHSCAVWTCKYHNMARTHQYGGHGLQLLLW